MTTDRETPPAKPVMTVKQQMRKALQAMRKADLKTRLKVMVKAGLLDEAEANKIAGEPQIQS